MFSDFVSPIVFIMSLVVGLFFVHLASPPYKKIFVYPTPDNKDNFQYVDRANNCIRFDSNIVKCPSDESLIKNIPFQK